MTPVCSESAREITAEWTRLLGPRDWDGADVRRRMAGMTRPCTRDANP